MKWKISSSPRVEDENDSKWPLVISCIPLANNFPDPDSIINTFLSHKKLQEKAKSSAEAASEAISVLQKLQTMNIKLRNAAENDLPVA